MTGRRRSKSVKKLNTNEGEEVKMEGVGGDGRVVGVAGTSSWIGLVLVSRKDNECRGHPTPDLAYPNFSAALFNFTTPNNSQKIDKEVSISMILLSKCYNESSSNECSNGYM